MTADASARPSDPGRAPAQVPESYFWPLVALILVILPQVLVPARLREGPLLIVPIIEGIVVLLLLAVAAKPGPVPRAARPLILSLFAVLVLANTAAAIRLVIVVLRGPSNGHAPATVTQLLVGAALVLATNVVTFGLLYWQLDSGGPSGRLLHSEPYPDFQFPQTGTEGLAPTGLAATVPRPPVPGLHQHRGVQPDRHPPTHPPRQGTHGHPVDDLPGRPGRGHLPGHQHPALLTTEGASATLDDSWRCRSCADGIAVGCVAQPEDRVHRHRMSNCSQRIRLRGIPCFSNPLAMAVIIAGGPHM